MQEYARLRRSERSLIFFINNVAHLTPAEHELVKLLLQDKKVAEIARLRHVEVVTVKTQIKGLLNKFGCLPHQRDRQADPSDEFGASVSVMEGDTVMDYYHISAPGTGQERQAAYREAGRLR